MKKEQEKEKKKRPNQEKLEMGQVLGLGSGVVGGHEGRQKGLSFAVTNYGQHMGPLYGCQSKIPSDSVG